MAGSRVCVLYGVSLRDARLGCEKSCEVGVRLREDRPLASAGVDSALPLRVLPGGVSRVPGDEFEIGYIAEGGVQTRERLGEAWSVRFEYADAVREFKSHKGMRHLPGR